MGVKIEDSRAWVEHMTDLFGQFMMSHGFVRGSRQFLTCMSEYSQGLVVSAADKSTAEAQGEYRAFYRDQLNRLTLVSKATIFQRLHTTREGDTPEDDEPIFTQMIRDYDLIAGVFGVPEDCLDILHCKINYLDSLASCLTRFAANVAVNCRVVRVREEQLRAHQRLVKDSIAFIEANVCIADLV